MSEHPASGWLGSGEGISAGVCVEVREAVPRPATSERVSLRGVRREGASGGKGECGRRKTRMRQQATHEGAEKGRDAADADDDEACGDLTARLKT
eukprot:1451051-Rhodomonas_salina.1